MIDKYKIWFCALPIQSKIKIEIIKNDINYKKIYTFREKLFKELKCYEKIMKFDLNNDKIKKIENGLKNGEYCLVTYDEKDYPNNFKEIEEPPFFIFYKGNIEEVNKRQFIGIVGSRKNSNYGELTTKRIVANLIDQYSIGIVSGGAIGIDSIAHRAATENKIFNIAVLGCGIDIVYPKSNVNLFINIIKNGVIMSEFLPGEEPIYYNFPRRNRLISAISSIVIVTEAGIKSGASNTAYHACCQNKSIYAVPGNIDSKFSEGCNLLINDGALIYLNIEQVFKEMGLIYKNTKRDINYKIKLDILKILGEEPVHFDRIVKEIKVDRNIINELLFEMQFNNDVIGLVGNNYMKILRNN
ncbi:DNA-processing protein DprA [uncultured Clostridium sp.]|jgi:DNA processing protein|uniref:DNA-processing protein DprA n=1 Tax=uncultured Clostridium sp. TaxID=59620 RepID=UPI002609FCBD|nr:DNA-processing protein DprA [uncultured Clostridium sp.]